MLSRENLRRWTTAVTLLVSITVAAADARAQGYISPLIGYDFGGDSGCPEIDDCEDKNLNLGLAIGRMGNVMGFELEFAYAGDFLGEAPGLSSNVLTAMGNVMFTPNLHPFRPYLLLGFGLVRTEVELTPAGLLETENSQFGWDAGGGLTIFFGDHVGIRGDLRYFHSFEEMGVLGLSLSGRKLDFGRVAGALVFRF